MNLVLHIEVFSLQLSNKRQLQSIIFKGSRSEITIGKQSLDAVYFIDQHNTQQHTL